MPNCEIISAEIIGGILNQLKNEQECHKALNKQFYDRFLNDSPLKIEGIN